MKCSKECLILAGIGGMIPTISRLASTYVTDPTTPLPEPGLYFGLFLFFIIGSVLAVAFSETNLRQAFIIGVCAPGIITNIVAGVNDAKSATQTVDLFRMRSISSAYAQTQTSASTTLAGSANEADTNSIQIPAQKKILIKSQLVGASSWDEENISIYLAVIGKDGSRKSMYRFPAIKGNIEIRIPEESSAIYISASGSATKIQLPENDYSEAVIHTHIVVEGKNDFLWALGAKRRPRVVSLSSDLVYVKRTKPGVTLRELLGEPVKMADGKIVGSLEEIKIGSTGEEIALIKDETGNIRLVRTERIEIVNNELVLRPLR
jgi:sporulation protein YlmC with PRC-barrel domain